MKYLFFSGVRNSLGPSGFFSLALFKNGQPDLEKQKRIVSYLDQISEKQKILLKIYENIDNQITQLKQSILNKAFRREL